jgi:hypothetical protein
MAASAWEVFDIAKKLIGNNTISLSATAGWNMTLHSQTASTNLSGATTTWGSIGSELTAANKYSTGGKAITGVTWATGLSAGQYAWSTSNVVFTASGGGWTSIRYAVIMFSIGAATGYPLCYAALSTAGFPLTDGNTLTVQINANGVFTLA